MAGLDGSDTSSTVYIDDLNPLNPVTGDPKSQGDDHIRFIKKVLKNTFPNIDAPVTATEDELNLLDGVTASTTELNYVDGVTSAIQTQIDTAKIFGIQFNLKIVSNGDYVLDEYATFGYTINNAVYDLSAGTCSIAVKIGGTAVTGLSALSATSSQGGPTSATALNTVSANGRVTITISSATSAADLSLKLKCTRT